MSRDESKAFEADALPRGAESGYAEHVTECAHAEHAIRDAVAADRSLLSRPCEGCGSAETWICLFCGKVLCGRWAGGCMLRHRADNELHDIALGTADLSVFCYADGCDSYVDHLTVRRVYDVYQRFHVAKFGEPLPMPFAGDAGDAGGESKSQ